jgi:Putative zinc-finger
MNDIWTNRLSEYLDGELDSTERAALEAHLASCGKCYATLGELRQVVAQARALTDAPPAHDLWAGIKTRITGGAPVASLNDRRDRLVRRRFSLTVGQLLAASIALVLLSSGGAYMALRPGTSKVTPQSTASRQRGIGTIATWTGPTDAAIADLQATLTQNESRLDTTTVRIVRQNLAIIDRAIGEARIALQKDPGNAYLNLHLADTMRRKVELLRRVNDIAAQS